MGAIQGETFTEEVYVSPTSVTWQLGRMDQNRGRLLRGKKGISGALILQLSDSWQTYLFLLDGRDAPPTNRHLQSTGRSFGENDALRFSYLFFQI